MLRALYWTAAISVALAPTIAQADAIPRGASYVNYTAADPWVDAEKSPLNNNSTNLCWAAAAANVLWYTGWGRTSNFHSTDDIYNYYINHWTDAGGMMNYAWLWWFDGTNGAQGQAGYSQVDVPGGDFYTRTDYTSAYHHQWLLSQAMSSVSAYLRSNYGVAMGIYTSGGSGAHAITVWGYDYDPANPSTYYGLWVTDSDDDKNLVTPPDRLRYYDVTYTTVGNIQAWYLQNFYGANNWYISQVQALAMDPAFVTPEPGTLLILLGGGAMLAIRRRRLRGA